MAFDFLFLIVYGLFIGLMIHKVNRVWRSSRFHSMGIVLIYLVFLASFFDIIENIALLLLLSGNLEQIWSSTAFYFAILKFIIIALALVFIIISVIALFFNKKRTLWIYLYLVIVFYYFCRHERNQIIFSIRNFFVRWKL